MPPSEVRVWVGAFAELIPPDATWVIVAEPRSLFAETAFRSLIEALAPDERWTRFAQHTGVDLRRAEELVLFGHQEGWSALVRGPIDAYFVVREVQAHMLPVESHSAAPFPRCSGHASGARRDLVALAPNTLLMTTGAPILTGAIVERSGQRDVAEMLDRIMPEPSASSFTLLVPRRFELPIESPLAILLARQTAMRFDAFAHSEDALTLRFDLRGEYPSTAEENFRLLARSLAESSLGRAIGLPSAVETLEIERSPEGMILRANVSSSTLAAGLRVLFEAEIPELLAIAH